MLFCDRGGRVNPNGLREATNHHAIHATIRPAEVPIAAATVSTRPTGYLPWRRLDGEGRSVMEGLDRRAADAEKWQGLCTKIYTGAQAMPIVEFTKPGTVHVNLGDFVKSPCGLAAHWGDCELELVE